VCSSGISFLKRCLDDLYFDVDSKVCQVFDFVFACSGQRPTTYIPVEQDLFVVGHFTRFRCHHCQSCFIFQNTPAPKKPKLYDCSNLPDGYYPNPNQQCSNFYHVCSNKQDDLVYCATGLFFDPDRKVCARFVEVPICSGLPPSEPEVPAAVLPSDFVPLPPG